MAWVLRAFPPPFDAIAFSKTAGGIFAPLRNPGIEMVLDISEHALSNAACVAGPGAVIVNSTADSGLRTNFVGIGSASDILSNVEDVDGVLTKAVEEDLHSAETSLHVLKS